MIPVAINTIKSFEVVEVCGHTAIFTDLRIDRKTIPDGFFVYDVRDGDSDGIPCELAPHVWVNYYGTIILRDKIEPNFNNRCYIFQNYDISEYEVEDMGEYEKEDISDALADGELVFRDGKYYQVEEWPSEFEFTGESIIFQDFLKTQ